MTYDDSYSVFSLRRGDVIRSMTNEQLAEWLSIVLTIKSKPRKDIIKWLESEVIDDSEELFDKD